MKEISTEISIRSSCERVWAALADFSSYPQWNPFIIDIAGRLEQGERLRVRIAAPGGRAMNFRPRVLAVLPGRELRWLGNLIVPGLFDGEHIFRLEPQGDGCHFRQEERFSGMLVSLMGSGPFDSTRRGFEAMNAALKKRAEA